jgi:hypothetical protein
MYILKLKQMRSAGLETLPQWVGLNELSLKARYLLDTALTSLLWTTAFFVPIIYNLSID